MGNNRGLIVTLVVIIIILALALTAAVAYIFMSKTDNSGNKIITNTQNNRVIQNTDDFDDEDANSIANNVVNNNTVINNSIDNNTVDNNVNNAANENTNSNVVNNTNNNSVIPDNPNTGTDMEKLAFNNKFMSYLGELTGTKLNELLDVVVESNKQNPNHKVSASSSTLQGLSEITETDMYVITFEYDDNGYVSVVNIEKKV